MNWTTHKTLAGLAGLTCMFSIGCSSGGPSPKPLQKLHTGALAASLPPNMEADCDTLVGENLGDGEDLVVDLTKAALVYNTYRADVALPEGIHDFRGKLLCRDTTTGEDLTLYAARDTRIEVTEPGWFARFRFPGGYGDLGKIEIGFCTAYVTAIRPTLACVGADIEVDFAFDEPSAADPDCEMTIYAKVGAAFGTTSIAPASPTATIQLTLPSAGGDYSTVAGVIDANGGELPFVETVVTVVEDCVNPPKPDPPTACVPPDTAPVTVGCAKLDGDTLSVTLAGNVDGTVFGDVKLVLDTDGVDFVGATPAGELAAAGITAQSGFNWAVPSSGQLTTIFMPDNPLNAVPIGSGVWMDVELEVNANFDPTIPITFDITGHLTSQVNGTYVEESVTATIDLTVEN